MIIKVVLRTRVLLPLAALAFACGLGCKGGVGLQGGGKAPGGAATTPLPTTGATTSQPYGTYAPGATYAPSTTGSTTDECSQCETNLRTKLSSIAPQIQLPPNTAYINSTGYSTASCQLTIPFIGNVDPNLVAVPCSCDCTNHFASAGYTSGGSFSGYMSGSYSAGGYTGYIVPNDSGYSGYYSSAYTGYGL